VYQGTTSLLDVKLYPTGIERKYLSMVSLDKDIVDFDQSGQLLAKQIGKATIRLDVDGVNDDDQKTTIVYVVRNKIQVFYRTEEGYYMNEDSTKYTSKINGTIYLAVKFEDIEKKGYSVEDGDLDVKWENYGCLAVREEGVTYDSVNPADPTMYIFKVPLKYDADNMIDKGYNGIEIVFSLPDGSKAQFNIDRK
jgi:hypothetical protein